MGEALWLLSNIHFIFYTQGPKKHIKSNNFELMNMQCGEIQKYTLKFVKLLDF